jgi:hypothetical protein
MKCNIDAAPNGFALILDNLFECWMLERVA